jgi:hypothetical protein
MSKFGRRESVWSCSPIAAVLGWELERSRGLRWWESVRWACRRWRRRGARAGARWRTRQGNRGATRCRVEEKKWKRERGGPGRGSRQLWVKDMAGNSPRPSGAGSGAVVRTGESGGVRVIQCGGLVGPGGNVALWSTTGCGRKRGE